MSRLRVLRVYHAAADGARERALAAAGVDVTLVVPTIWPGLTPDLHDVVHHVLAVRRPGDVNRHVHARESDVRRVLAQVRPDVLDLHEEPVSLVARQWMRLAPDVPVVLFTAQNLDKRWPPPFARYERAALRRAAGVYPCSAQAASVVRGKGYAGAVRILPLGLDPAIHRPGNQALPAAELVLGLVGRLVPEKGVLDAVEVLARVHRRHPARLLLVGEGPAAPAARRLSERLGVSDRCEWLPWSSESELAAAYRRMHVVLVPSRPTTRWVEQFGRVITEGRAGGAVVAGYASGAIPEVLADSGIAVAPGDVGALAVAVLDLVARPAHWAELRAAGLQATAALSWDAVAAGQVQLYDAAVRSGPRPLARAGSRTRLAARAEFGPPASTPAGERPFALPVLRREGPVPRLLGGAVDVLTRQR